MSEEQAPAPETPLSPVPEPAGTPVPAGEPLSPVPPAGEEVPADPVPADGTGGAQSPAAAGSGDASADGPAIEDPVEILVGMAERGEIDPWNINIIEVTDRFLDELDRRRQLNLRVSGRTLFYAATLLRMKSEHLAEADGGDAEEGADDFGDDFDAGLDDEFEYEGRLGVIEQLEREIQRRLDRKNLRKSPVTLFELIIELKNIEKEERRRRRLVDVEPMLPDADDVVSIAHDEGYQDTAVTVYQECLRCMVREEEMTLAELCRKLEWDVPEVYIPLLFLMLDGQCALRQDEFFGDVYVQVCKAGDSIETTLLENG
jgi:segregation and condensation protein A